MRREFLFVLWSGGGNVPPQLVLARKLAQRGHTVRVLAPAVLRSASRQAGLVFEPYRRAPEHDEAQREHSIIRDFEARTPIGAVMRARTNLIAGTAAAFAADTFDLARDHGADVWCSTTCWSVLRSARRRPVSRPCHWSTTPIRSGLPGPRRSAWGSRRPGTALNGSRFARVLGFEQLMARPLLAPLNEVRKDLGLPPLAYAIDAFTDTARVLVLTKPSVRLRRAASRDGHLRRPAAGETGPTQRMGAAGGRRQADGTRRPQHDVSAAGGLLTRVIEALGALPVKGLVGTGPVLRPATALADQRGAPLVHPARASDGARRRRDHPRRSWHGDGRAGTRRAAGVPADRARPARHCRAGRRCRVPVCGCRHGAARARSRLR